MAVNDVHRFGAMFESVAVVTNVIARYSLVEKLYLQTDTAVETGPDSELVASLKEAILGLYSAILTFLHKANNYFQQSKISK